MRRITSYYERERQKGRTYSAVLHFVFFLFIIFGLPEFLSPQIPEEPAVITVELLPITGITNVKPSDTQPAPEIKPEEKPNEQKKPAPPVKAAETPPPPPPEKVAEKPMEKPKEKPVEKPKEKPPEKKKPKPKDDLSAILKAVKDTAQKEKKEDKKDKKPVEEATSPAQAVSNQYNPTLPMSMSEKDAIMSQLAKCWSVPAGAKDAQNLVVMINAEYNSDGSVIKAELAQGSLLRYNTDDFFRAAADSAIRAVKMCSPLSGLPPEKYETWRMMELQFDPRFMLN
jgi:outer membrane biosynthesis protein TonB